MQSIISSTWIRKIGFAGFLFFLVKGLVWLFVGAAVFELAG